MLPPIASAGSVLIASMLCYLLFGAYCVQLASYYSCVPDRRSLRTLVCTITACVLLHLILATEQAWKILVVSAGDPEKLDWPPKHTVLAIPTLNGISAMLVQGYFAWRVWVICQRGRTWIRIFVPSLIVITSVAQFGATIASTVLFGQMEGRFSELLELQVPIAIHLVSALVSDALITGSMVYILHHYKARSSFAGTKTLLNTLIIHVIENALITTICAAGNLISFFAGAPVLVAYAFQYVMGGLYAIVLVTTLNRRWTVRNQHDTPGQGVELLQFSRTRRSLGGTDLEDAAPREAMAGRSRSGESSTTLQVDTGTSPESPCQIK